MAIVLVVDDDPTIRMLCVGMLSEHDCIEAGNGYEALRQFESQPIDLVITDLVMPEMNGNELIQLLRAREPNLPILAITGSGAEFSVRTQFRNRFPDVPLLEKPFTLRDLTDHTSSLL